MALRLVVIEMSNPEDNVAAIVEMTAAQEGRLQDSLQAAQDDHNEIDDFSISAPDANPGAYEDFVKRLREEGVLPLAENDGAAR